MSEHFRKAQGSLHVLPPRRVGMCSHSAHARLYVTEAAEDELHMLVQMHGSRDWVVLPDVRLVQTKNKDNVSWDMTEPLAAR